MIVYEWVEGEPLPRIVGDTGSQDLATAEDSTDKAVDQNKPTSDDYLRGADSPFFEPNRGEGSDN